MSNTPEYENLQPETATQEMIGQLTQTDLETNEQMLPELSKEQLEEATGGLGHIPTAYRILRDIGYGRVTSVKGALSTERFKNLYADAFSIPTQTRK